MAGNIALGGALAEHVQSPDVIPMVTQEKLLLLMLYEITERFWFSRAVLLYGLN